MRTPRLKTALLAAAILALASAATLGVRVLDGRVRLARETESLTLLARQLATATEGLAFYARAKGERDPMAWAADRLAQGVEPRVLKIQAYKDTPGQALEKAGFDSRTGRFELSRVVAPEDGTALRIQLDRSPMGFLGFEGRFAEDLATAAIFLGSALVLAAPALRRRSRGRSAESDRIRRAIRTWLKSAKAALIELGTHMRETVRCAHDLTVAAAKSRGSVGELRDRIHRELLDVHRARQTLRGAREFELKLEAQLLNVVLEASRAGEKGSRLLSLVEELRREVSGMRRIHEEAEAAVSQLERRLEPMAVDADVAFHSFDEVFKTSQGMDGHIRRTTESMLAQAKLIQGANAQLGEDAPKPGAGAGAADGGGLQRRSSA